MRKREQEEASCKATEDHDCFDATRPPPFRIGDVCAAVPLDCWRKSPLRSLSYVAHDVAARNPSPSAPARAPIAQRRRRLLRTPVGSTLDLPVHVGTALDLACGDQVLDLAVRKRQLAIASDVSLARPSERGRRYSEHAKCFPPIAALLEMVFYLRIAKSRIASQIARLLEMLLP